jgi:hypothetical protein
MVPNSENYSAGNLLIKHRPITTEEILAETYLVEYFGGVVFYSSKSALSKA